MKAIVKKKLQYDAIVNIYLNKCTFDQKVTQKVTTITLDVDNCRYYLKQGNGNTAPPSGF